MQQRPRHCHSPPRAATVLRTDRPEVQDPLCTLITDSEGVYDALNNELPQDDKKSAVEIPIIEQLMVQMFGRCRWVSHNFNPSDPLTKIKGAHLQPCLDLLSSGMYHLKTESANFAERAAEKEKTGRKARNKNKFQSPNQPSVGEHEPHRGQWFWHFCGFFQLTQKSPLRFKKIHVDPT